MVWSRVARPMVRPLWSLSLRLEFSYQSVEEEYSSDLPLCLCAHMCGLLPILGLQERTKDTRLRSCSLPSAITEILGKALGYGGRTNGVFVSLLFLKILSWRVFQIIEEIMSFHFDFDSLKINYFPWCLHFHLLQLGHYVLGRGPWGTALPRAGSFSPHPATFDC